jgi:hypothetical protein
MSIPCIHPGTVDAFTIFHSWKKSVCFISNTILSYFLKVVCNEKRVGSLRWQLCSIEYGTLVIEVGQCPLRHYVTQTEFGIFRLCFADFFNCFVVLADYK